MTQISFKSAGVSVRVQNLTGPTATQPTGVPAGVIGTAARGPAFVPVTVPTPQDFLQVFGSPNDYIFNGPLAATEWLRNAQSLTYLRTLGAGDGLARTADGDNTGRVNGAGFVVGAQLPQDSLGGALGNNAAATLGDIDGRTYFLATAVSQSAGSTYLTEAGLFGSGSILVRGVLMAPSGVMPLLSSSVVEVNEPDPTGAAPGGSTSGDVLVGNSLQEFTLLLNGFTNSTEPMIITASFDVTAPNYLGKVLNTDPFKIEEKGHYLYADFPIHPSLAVVTGGGIIPDGNEPTEPVAFLLSGSAGFNSGSATRPNFEGFEDRFKTPKTPWIVSQDFGGSPQNLFRVWSLDDGQYANARVKVSVENITPSNSTANQYGTFDIVVRAFDDTDKNKRVLEQWRGLSLNPDAGNYIARIIGDFNTFWNFDNSKERQKLITEGNYPNASAYIRVEMDSQVEDKEVDPTALPFGFRGIQHFQTFGTSPFGIIPQMTGSVYSDMIMSHRVAQPPVPFRRSLARGSVPNQSADRGLYWGVQFERQTSVTEPNASTEAETGLRSFVQYYPDYQTSWANFVVFDNEGTLPTPENGIIDADEYNNNRFSLNRVKVKYNTTSGFVDTVNAVTWSYVREGNIANDAVNGFRALEVADLIDGSVRQLAKFSLPMFGGFDGVNMFNRSMKHLTNRAVQEEMTNTNRGTINGPTVSSYLTSLGILSDVTEVDLQLLTVPGIRNSYVTDNALSMVESRFDALYLMDIQNMDTDDREVSSSAQTLSVVNSTNQFNNRGVNSSFGAAYFPDVVMRDEFTRTTRLVSPSTAVLGAFAKNDAVSYPWFAPAGFARGALETTVRPAVRLSRENMDDLQAANINPLVSFAGSEGTVVWGQKTLLQTESALERVNVRRLLISLRRQVKGIADRILFEQNREATLERFSNLVKPILKRVQDNKGVDRFLVKIDTTTTTQADIENNTIRGKIFILPTKTLEFLDISFVINNRNNFLVGS